MGDCQAADIINALTPIVTAVLAAIPSYMVGARRPRPEEHALRAQLEARGPEPVE